MKVLNLSNRWKEIPLLTSKARYNTDSTIVLYWCSQVKVVVPPQTHLLSHSHCRIIYHLSSWRGFEKLALWVLFFRHPSDSPESAHGGNHREIMTTLGQDWAKGAQDWLTRSWAVMVTLCAEGSPSMDPVTIVSAVRKHLQTKRIKAYPVTLSRI